jgi:hypothetical protein
MVTDHACLPLCPCPACCSNWLDEDDGDEEAATRPATKVQYPLPVPLPPAACRHSCSVAALRRQLACHIQTHRRIFQSIHSRCAALPVSACLQVEVDLGLSAHANARAYYDNRRKHQARQRSSARQYAWCCLGGRRASPCRPQHTDAILH